MKLLTTVLPFLCASLVSSRSVLGSSSQAVLDPAFKVPGENPLYYCEDPSNYPMVTVASVDLSPSVPLIGEHLVIDAKGKIKDEIKKGAKVQLRVKLGVITLINHSYDLCDGLDKIDLHCPLEEGSLAVHREADIPSVAPKGNYNVFADVVTADGEQILCMQADVRLERPS